MSRKKYSEYKADETVKTPLFAWLMDRSILYVAFFVVAGLVVSGFIKAGTDSFKSILEDPVEDSPYMTISASDSPGSLWGSSLIQMKPTGVSEWTVSKSKKPNYLFDEKTCPGQGVVPDSVLASFLASGGGLEVRIQTYGAGQARAQFDAYRTVYEACFNNIKEPEVGLGNAITFDNGFVLTMGDSIISGVVSDYKKVDEFLKFYVENASTTLDASGCIARSVSSGDASRNFFYDAKSYKGLFKKEIVSTEVDITNLPQPQVIELNKIIVESMVEPESPLPSDFKKLPKEVSMPVFPDAVKDQDNFDETAKFAVEDIAGPGCGWLWSAQKAPVYDKDKLSADYENSISDAQKAANEAAQKYVAAKKQWALDVARLLPEADAWNKYVLKVNEIHERWEWLNLERIKLKEPWDAWSEKYIAWDTFDERKEQAEKDYQDALLTCQQQQDDLNSWEETWGDLYEEQEAAKKARAKEEARKKKEESSPESVPTATPNPGEQPSEEPTSEPTDEPTYVDIPEKPSGCNEVPEQPEILTQDKPKKPKAPKIPEGVTIPDSWFKPEDK